MSNVTPILMSDSEGAVALVPSGFVYRGVFYGRGVGGSGWRAVSIPFEKFQALLKAAK